jgi:vWA-MoxR associated protein C-terminal domain/Trypsin-like peptidase domain/vWA-MoxR associated protein middle region 0
MIEQQLRQLLRDCLVQIDSADGDPAGSGFFIAPDYVLTCSHVLGSQPRGPVTGKWNGRQWSGTVDYASPSPPGTQDTGSDNGTAAIWPEPDLAVIRVEGGAAHPCVRVSPAEPEEGSLMIAAGRRLPFGDVPDDFTSATLEYTGKFRYLMRLKGERFGPGMSGGPVLDLSTGEVCGIAKLAGPDQDGYAVPVRLAYDLLPPEVAASMLRSHDRYHGSDRAWGRAQRVLWEVRPVADAALLPPDSEAELLGLLARLPETDTARLGWLYRRCAGTTVRPDTKPPRELRDVALSLADLMHERGRPHPVIIFAELLATGHPELAADLRDWSTAEATRQGTRELLHDWRSGTGSATQEARTAANPMSVVIQIEPSNRSPDRYVYTIWRNREDVIMIERENEPLELSEIQARLKGKLPAVLGELSGEHVIVEFILPPELFDEPVHLWQVFRSPHIRLGHRYQVVIRDGERFYEPEERNHAKIKWDWLSAQSTTRMQWLRCVDHRTIEQLYPWFEARRERAALGMPGPARANNAAMSAALDAGVRVAFWRLTCCETHDGTGASTNNGPCDGMVFRQAARKKVAPEPVHLLPEMVRYLRISPGALSESALLWDDPYRGPHPRGLAAH